MSEVFGKSVERELRRIQEHARREVTREELVAAAKRALEAWERANAEVLENLRVGARPGGEPWQNRNAQHEAMLRANAAIDKWDAEHGEESKH